ncbi:hypothetical protein [Streptomyces pseudovenezuelae]|uniref:hypothetical protein n=1 Tax=Streptomyces pseudovenezuelae TaxID=67350 RepID=UPI002E3491F6|nr:hypothetical protein [Streptomyces pseudovenezuelae]
MYRAKDTFWAPDNRRIVKGDLVAPHDPVLEGREELFEEVVIPTAVGKPPTPPAKKTAAKKTAAKPPAKDGAADGPEATEGPAKTEDPDGGDAK